MDRVVPAESDLLCESCGYTLNGLPQEANCPECGVPVVNSTADDGRGLTGFEERPGASSFFATTVAVLLRPHRFYRAIVTRQDHPAAAIFARRHRIIAAGLFALAAVGYARWLESQSGRTWRPGGDYLLPAAAFVALWGLTYLLMTYVTRLAAWLSALEGRYWGMRLPHSAVARCLQYHAASYLPVGLLAAGLVWGYWFGLRAGVWSWRSAQWYPWILSGAVVVSAGYLFAQYLVAMRNIRYANR